MNPTKPINRLRTELTSVNDFLYASDIESFRPGRSMDDILEDVQWRGHLVWACGYKGKSLYAIVYGLLAGDYSKGLERDPDAQKGAVYAIFLDDRFVKFVKGVQLLRDEKEEYEIEGTKAHRARPIKVGDFRWLIRLLESEPFDIEDVQKGVRERPAPPLHIDWGLTIVTLVLGPLLLLSEFIRRASKCDYKRNAELRDQFNGARVRIGMTESEVESVLGAQPLESGEVEAGSYRIYGSNESFNINLISLHFRNILVVLREGRVIGTYTAPPGAEWRRELGEWFMDLPNCPGYLLSSRGGAA